MNPYALIDLHCDTLTDCTYSNPDPDTTIAECTHKGPTADTLDDPGRVLSLSSLPSDVHWAQFYAIFIPDQHRGQAAIDYYETNRDNFYRQMEKFHDRISPCHSASDMHSAWETGKTAAFLTIEGGAALAGDITRVKKLADDGVRCMTLTWNGENEIGSGHTTTHGMTDFGRQAVREMEDRGILVDVSHLNDTGYADLFETARRPFVATHSNARAICSHKRNLTDDMIREMVRRNCLIGLNYYTGFITNDKNYDDPENFYRHIEHFFELGAYENLALGSDFDGAHLPTYLNSPAKSAALYEYFLEKGMSKELAEGIMFRNAEEFFKKNL